MTPAECLPLRRRLDVELGERIGEDFETVGAIVGDQRTNGPDRVYAYAYDVPRVYADETCGAILDVVAEMVHPRQCVVELVSYEREREPHVPWRMRADA